MQNDALLLNTRMSSHLGLILFPYPFTIIISSQNIDWLLKYYKGILFESCLLDRFELMDLMVRMVG